MSGRKNQRRWLALVAAAAFCAIAADDGMRPMSLFRARRTIANLSRRLQLDLAALRNPTDYVDVYPHLTGAKAQAAAGKLAAAGIDTRITEDGRLQVPAADQTTARLIVDGLLDTAEPFYEAPSPMTDWGP